MYRHGLGDCLLVRLPHATAADGWFNVMIDCGLLLGTPDAAARMTRVVEDVAAETGGRLDLLAVTHEHWDHVSGFIQARDAFRKIEVGAVWAAWTENEDDTAVQALKDGRRKALAALQSSSTRLRTMGADGAAGEVDGLLAFFGIGAGPDGSPFAAAGGSTPEALRTALTLGKELRYCRPSDPPFQPEGADWRIYVLGPPRDAVLLKKSDPSKRTPETYPLAAAAEGLVTALGADEDAGRPFNRAWAIPMARTRELEFFQRTYHAEAEAWRSIDEDWLGTTTELALKLDSDTNNTSLVLAIELPAATPEGEPEVLLFAADAQVGNWLSWQDLTWTVDGRTVTGPDLLKRTTLYKVGHHGSHNATLREKGLELMDGLRVALIPVDEAIAKKKRWNQMPRASIIERLNAMVPGAVLRSDEDAADQPWLTKDALYYEVTL
ncbi:MBL fold metallo-hydrolase [Azospirillum sp.]|uniref:MBL fold metallo-hydrolase n=1 Tax=Azospirillum sp. TaxID=34012 RepID=UPI003D72C825